MDVMVMVMVLNSAYTGPLRTSPVPSFLLSICFTKGRVCFT